MGVKANAIRIGCYGAKLLCTARWAIEQLLPPVDDPSIKPTTGTSRTISFSGIDIAHVMSSLLGNNEAGTVSSCSKAVWKLCNGFGPRFYCRLGLSWALMHRVLLNHSPTQPRPSQDSIKGGIEYERGSWEWLYGCEPGQNFTLKFLIKSDKATFKSDPNCVHRAFCHSFM